MAFVLQATVNTWKLGWNFTAGETVQNGNLYTAGVEPLVLNGTRIHLESTSGNNTVNPFSWTSVSLLGTKSMTPVPNAPYRVSIDRSVFVCLKCKMSLSHSKPSIPSSMGSFVTNSAPLHLPALCVAKWG